MQQPVIALVTHDAQIALQVRTVLDDNPIVEFRTGQAALTEDKEVIPALTIIDTHIPDIPWERLVIALRAARLQPHHPILLMGSSHILEQVAFQVGIQDIIGRPPHPVELHTRVTTFLRMKVLQDELEDVRNVLVSLAHALEARDPYTHHHSERTATYAVELAKALAFPEEECENIRIAGLLHDIGKIGVPDFILGKTERLSDEEYEAIKVHPVVSERICMSIAHFQHVLPFIRHHHERVDGRGYPDGLSGKAIPGPARIIAIADTYDALTSTRPYRTALAPRDAVKVLTTHAGSQWDPCMVDVFAELIQQDICYAISTDIRPMATSHAH